VPHDWADTLNSTLPSGASFLCVVIASITSSSSSLCEIVVYLHPLLHAHSRGNSSSSTALLRIILCAVLSLGPIETRALKALLELLVQAMWSLLISCLGIRMHFPSGCCLEEMLFPIHASLNGTGAGSCCPSRQLLVETKSPNLVSLDLSGIGLHCLGEETNSPGTKKHHCGHHVHRYSMVGIVGNDGYSMWRPRIYGY